MRTSVIITTLDPHKQYVDRLLRQIPTEVDEVVFVSTDDIDHTDTFVALDGDESLPVARNMGAAVAQGQIYAFLDDDVVLPENWYDALMYPYEEMDALAVGGPAYPRWVNCNRPIWMTRNLDWLVGCGPYHTSMCRIRNSYGCNISFRSDIFDELKGFNKFLGKGNGLHAEETELCMRMENTYGEQLVYNPDMKIEHLVFDHQLNFLNMLKRAYRQGRSKGITGFDDTESSYLMELLKDYRSYKQYVAQCSIIGATGAGYVHGRIQ